MKRILLVDDEAHVTRVLKMALERAGFLVDDAATGEEALAYLQQLQPDVLITDIDMPRMDGRELCSRIQADMPEREFMIFVLTARTEHEHREWSAAIPNLQFMEKPVSVRKLVSTLEAVFPRETVGEA